MAFLTTVGNALLIMLGFTVLIFVHELGHFLAAKWAGIRTEAFAIGMGGPVISWRRGIGIRFGSTDKDVEKRVRAHVSSVGSSVGKAVESGAGGEAGAEPKAPTLRTIHQSMDALGIGETEYSLRWLPLGGFVKMLGQEDANPNAVSDDPRSYGQCPVGKRMIVVSAGVIMNLILAVLVFILVFFVGVRLEAPIIGGVLPGSPASSAMATNAAEAGVTEPGLHAGDRVTSIDGEEVTTFPDVVIASAMSKLTTPLHMVIHREGVSIPLRFDIMPEHDETAGLPSIGVEPAASTTLREKLTPESLEGLKSQLGSEQTAIGPGWSIATIDGRDVHTWEQIEEAARRSEGKPLDATWIAPAGESGTASLSISVERELQTQIDADETEGKRSATAGILGLAPLGRVDGFAETSPNKDRLKKGDIILALDGTESPRYTDVSDIVKAAASDEIPARILRDGKEAEVVLTRRHDLIGISAAAATELPQIGRPIDRLKLGRKKDAPIVESPVAPLRLMAGSRILKVNDAPVGSWFDLAGLVRDAVAAGQTQVSLTYSLPLPDAPTETATVQIAPELEKSIASLSWEPRVSGVFFESQSVVRSAGGNPWRAVVMGYEETKKAMTITYLTIDRLLRRTVGVEQLRGPVGIVHLGTQVADRGLMYVLLLLAMISVNLAVLNFLPLPIVDGGLFLFLIYEKISRRPPPLWFQNAATMVGLVLIAGLFLVTFYNDVMRLIR